jgi:hypothetical protein
MYYLPTKETFTLSADMHILWEYQIIRPFDDLLVRVGRVFGAKWCITNKTLEHDRTE